ncbi:uncharacterized protein TM35_000171830 [Trypanosoma theileri]|uniref:Uncharacterized protein n=1 Tax=Trypanosoma theileri TaxID=67003 RepID=A0A1X0NUM4_9TRYP|nr:uncharacterized protein TM35_000171830 [Trypanosoma theileri]ORC88311.1 hypothetical protein TM35_000171830 [Trypanosoma theileri]
MSEGYTAATGGEGALSELLVAEDKIQNALVPDDVVIRDYLNCINDDTWVRHAELVRLSDLKETPHEEAVKEEVLRSYIEERRRSNAELPRDLIMEGILWQEKFMDEYKKEHRSQDKEEASNYKKALMERFRNKRSDRQITGGAASDVKAIEYGGKKADSTMFSMNAAGTNNKGAFDQPPSMYTPTVRQEQPESDGPTTTNTTTTTTKTATTTKNETPNSAVLAPEATEANATNGYPVEEQTAPSAEAVQQADDAVATEPNTGEYPTDGEAAPVAEAAEEQQPEATEPNATNEYPVEEQTAPSADVVQQADDAVATEPNTGEYPADGEAAPVAEAAEEQQPEATEPNATNEYPVEEQAAPAEEAVPETVDGAVEAPEITKESPNENNTSAVEPAAETDGVNLGAEI